MTWGTLHAVAWMSLAAISAWLLIDGFQSGRTIGSRNTGQRENSPRAYWTVQTATALVLIGAAYGLFRTLEAMNLGI
jgi:hypothetical protein